MAKRGQPMRPMTSEQRRQSLRWVRAIDGFVATTCKTFVVVGVTVLLAFAFYWAASGLMQR